MFTFILVLQGLVAAALIGVILMQKSEGGGLGVGGSPAGFLSARGASDFLTRATAILASLFVGLCIVLAVVASINHRSTSVDVEAAKGAMTPAAPAVPLTGEAAVPTQIPLSPGAPGGAAADPLAGAAANSGTADTPQNSPAQQGVPLQQ
jgi:preprotein translocase subunit SecG